MAKPLLHLGHLTTRRSLLLRGTSLLVPPLLWLLALLILPCLLLLPLAFASTGDNHEILLLTYDDSNRRVWHWTLENFYALLGYDDIFGWTTSYFYIYLRSVTLALITTALCVLLAYPLAFFIAGRSPRWRYFWLITIMIPLCTNIVIRTYAWELLLSRELPLSRLARALGYLGPDESLAPSQLAIYIGMISCSLPFAVLPLYTNVERLDHSLIEAARDLYASPLRIFRHAILPQTTPGLRVATILTFIPSLGIFVVPSRLGGGKVMYLGDLIQQQFNSAQNFPRGAALSFALVLITLLTLLLLGRRIPKGDLL